MSSMRAALGWLVLVLLFLPFLVLLARFPVLSLSLDERVWSVLAFTALQAALSAAASIALGVPGALGLLAFPRTRVARVLEAGALLPNVVPTLMVILAAMNLFPHLRGLPGLVALHAILNGGLVAVSVASLASSRLGRIAELAWVEGSSRWQFLSRGVIPYLRSDLLKLFVFVFAICFTSFAVPLLIAGSRATTIEVLIYEKLRLEQDWSGAVVLAFIQTLAVLAFSWFLRRGPSGSLTTATRLPLLAWKPGLVFALGPTFIIALGLIWQLPQGVAQMSALSGFVDEFPRLLAGSAFVGLFAGVMTVGVLLLLMAARPRGVLRRILFGFVAPSSVLTGFALLILWRQTGGASLVKIAIGCALISIPALYRLQWDGWLRATEGQVTLARTLGASESLIFTRVLLPQLWSPALSLGGLAAFWAWGDFALSAVVGEKTLTVAMLTQALMGSYRLPAATVLVWILILGGTMTFMVFWGVGRVFGTRSDT